MSQYMFEIKDYKIFFRHFLYGSALTIGTLIGTNLNLYNGLTIFMLVMGTLLMIKSCVITWVVNKYPEEFKEYT